VTGALCLLAVLAPLAVLASEMPRRAAWPLAVLALGWGGRRAWREWHRPPLALDWPPPEGTAVQWRGPLLFVRGPGLRLAWWPDTLDEGTRRELRRRGTIRRCSNQSPSPSACATSAPSAATASFPSSPW